MKRALVFVLIIISVMNTVGQTKYIDVCSNCGWGKQFDFNSGQDSASFYFYTDTTQTNNLWQIGNLNKTVFTSGYYNQRALVTDTTNTYAINNISSVQFSVNCGNTNCPGVNYWGPRFDIVHRMDSDLGIDGGTIEVTYDNGLTWMNIIQDTIGFPYIEGSMYTLNDTIKSIGKPGFSGSIDWNFLKISYQPGIDTATFRFTFTSDSIQTDKDGWMIGYLTAMGEYENIQEFRSSNLISVFPNPSNNQLLVIPDNSRLLKGEISIIDNLGRVIKKDREYSFTPIDISDLDNGLYFLNFTDGKNYFTTKFIKK